jgi:predicted RNase H-like nuclease (RuvC/YqgF family)
MNNGKSAVNAPKERKSVEDTVTSLRQELQVLYESLKDKNEQLLCLEKDVRDRDISIKYLKGECKKLAPNCGNCHKKVVEKSDENGASVQPDEVVTKLQKDLKDREGLIKELNAKIIRLSDNLIFVQKESLSKDDRHDEMQREIDKFRQVVILTLINIGTTNNFSLNFSRFDRLRKPFVSSASMKTITFMIAARAWRIRASQRRNRGV